MIELQVLALAGLPARLFKSRYGWIRARRAIPAEREPLFAFLADLDNHWQLAAGFVTEVRVDGPVERRDSAEVMLRGPLGLRRRARTTVRVSVAPRLLVGYAELGRRTVARVTWVLSAGRGGATTVELSAVVERVGLLDGLVLALGGRDWLERRFDATLAEVGATAARQEHRPLDAAGERLSAEAA